MVNRAHFPEIYSKSMPSQRSANSSDSNGVIEEEGKEIVDWKYNHPQHLTGNVGAIASKDKSGGDVIDQDGDDDFSGTEEDEDEDDDHRF